MLIRRADQKGLLLWAILVIAAAVLFVWSINVPLWLCVFLATNVSTFLVMLIDKIQARTGDGRISERSLYLMTLLGGSVGMLIAMYTLRHKSRKMSFQIVVWLLVFVQLVIIYQFVELPLLSTGQTNPFGIQ